MMRWPSAYCATSNGISRSIMRSSTQPTRPAELRTRYQSSITGFGGAGGLPGALADALAEGAGLAGTGAVLDCGGVVGAPFGLCVAFADADFGGFFSAVARFRTSTLSPSLS